MYPAGVRRWASRDAGWHYRLVTSGLRGRSSVLREMARRYLIAIRWHRPDRRWSSRVRALSRQATQ